MGANNLKTIAEQKGLKMKFLIDKSGYSRRSFYAFIDKKNARQAPDDFLLNIANALGVSISVIV